MDGKKSSDWFLGIRGASVKTMKSLRLIGLNKGILHQSSTNFWGDVAIGGIKLKLLIFMVPKWLRVFWFIQVFPRSIHKASTIYLQPT